MSGGGWWWGGSRSARWCGLLVWWGRDQLGPSRPLGFSAPSSTAAVLLRCAAPPYQLSPFAAPPCPAARGARRSASSASWRSASRCV